MGFWAFLGGFLAVAVIIGILVASIRKRVQRFSRQVFGTADLMKALSDVDTADQEQPRSLNGLDSILLPRILKDFPDFDVTLAKTYVRDELRSRFGDAPSFQIHNVVISNYIPTAVQKTIVFQAALCFREQERLSQKRYELKYVYLLTGEESSVAGNCPNCGGAMGYGDRECSFCGCRIANVLGNVWQFTEVREA